MLEPHKELTMLSIGVKCSFCRWKLLLTLIILIFVEVIIRASQSKK